MLEGCRVSFERRNETNNIVHVRKNTRLRTKVAESDRHHVLKQPRRIINSKRHTFKTKLAGRSDECCPVDVLFCDG